MNTIIEKTVGYVKKELEDAEGGHDWHHINRVWKNALIIANEEPTADRIVVELGALLHDIADSKFHDGNEKIGPQKAAHFLKDLNLSELQMNQVVDIIKNISYKGGHNENIEKSIELQIVQDADRLDAMGAIGIARTFNYGGFKNNTIYDPDRPPQLNMSKEEYKKGESTTINHFYEKLLLLKDLMNTHKGYALALERHDYMKDFLNQFYREWNADA
ncbi:MAG: HD domain-containing protein [Nonlabens sp.]